MISQSSRGAARILVIDDEPKTVEVITEVLKHAGYSSIRGLTRPHEAAQVCREFQPDLVLLDLIMPEMSGYEVLRELRALDGEGEPLPVVILTADASQEARRVALGEGATDFIIKPFDAAEIILRTGHLLETRFLNRALLEQNHALTDEVRERRQAEEELRESLEENARLAAAIEASPTAVVLSDPNQPDNPLVFVNPAFTRITGYEAEDVLGQNCRFLQGPKTDPGAVRRMGEAIQNRTLFREALLNYRKDGSEFWNELTVSPVFSPEGRLINFVGLQVDVTHEHREREARHESEERFRQLAESIGDVFWIAAADGGQILYTSPAFETVWGIEAAEVYRNAGRWHESLHPEDRQRVMQAVRTRNHSGGYVIEYRIVRPDGEIRLIKDRAFPVYDSEGRIYRMAGLAEDITARRAAEDTLDRFFTLSLDLLVTSGFDGYFQRLNPAWEATLGWTCEEMMATPFIDFVHPEDRESSLAETRRLSEGRETIRFENRYRCKDGSYKPLVWTARPDVDRQLLYATARDVTESKKAQRELIEAKEEAERANAAKSEFLSRMSHELRTPLNAILGFGQLLEMNRMEPSDLDSVEQILKAGRHLLELINEVLQLSGIEAGRLQFSLEPVSVGDVIREACALVRPLADTRRIDLNVPAEGGAGHLLADRQRLLQVLLNFLANAVKYHREGGQVTVDSAVTGDRCRISVTDDGPGIAEGKQGKLFVPFERLGADRTGVEGTGLGLALSKTLIEAMGGAIGVETEEGRGSVFWCELPTAIPAQSAAQAPRDPLPAPGCAARILYIEDNLSNLRLVEQLFATRRHLELLSAMQGRLGLDLARQHHPDLILLDLHLPDMAGDEVLRQLRADPATADIPVLMLSADAISHQVERLLAAGARAYVTKPFDIPALLRLVDETLAAR